jgi:hypothetical protein
MENEISTIVANSKETHFLGSLLQNVNLSEQQIMEKWHFNIFCLIKERKKEKGFSHKLFFEAV